MLTFRTIEFELEKPREVIEKVRLFVVEKPLKDIRFNLSWDRKPKAKGNFQNDSSFLLSFVHDYWTPRDSMFYGKGLVKGEDTIVIQLCLTLWGAVCLFLSMIFVAIFILLSKPQDFVMATVIGITYFSVGLFGLFRDLNRTDKSITRLIETGEISLRNKKLSIRSEVNQAYKL